MTVSRVCLVLGLFAAAAPPAAAVAPPGPPPENGTRLPVPPGTAPPVVPPGTAVSIPAAPAGPALAGSGHVRLDRTRRSFALRLACRADGALRVTARTGTVARGRYRCVRNHATARLRVSRREARRIAGRTAAATATVREAGRMSRLSFELSTRPAPAPVFWTDGHLQCGSPAYLVEPDFTAATPIPVSTRGWVAWHTPHTGWHWLGANGENAGRWNTWTATPTGIEQFHPGGATLPTPWTLGPITAPDGQGITAVGVFEIVYWVGGRPDHQWHYVNAGSTGAVAAGGGTLACRYP